LLAAFLSLALPVPSRADDAAKSFDSQVRPILKAHCVGCHGPDRTEKDLRLDEITADLSSEPTQDRWRTILNRVKAGEMPPKAKPRLSASELETLSKWINGALETSDAPRKAEGRTVLRRLNRIEYQNTIRDLLGIDLDLLEMLPVDSSTAGFDNVGEGLHTSSFLMERYLATADAALNVAIANGPQPPLVKKRVSLKDERHVKVTTENVFRHLDDALVMFSSSAWQGITLSQFYPPDRGRYRFRISASAVQSGGKPVTFVVNAGPMLMATKNHLVNYYDAQPDAPTLIEFTDHLEARSTIRLLPYGLASAQAVNKIGADTYEGPGLKVEWIEVEGPLHDAWPPESHRRIFGDLKQAPAPEYNRRNRVEVVSENPEADAAQILQRFAGQAFRRPVTEAEIEPYVQLVLAKQAAGSSFEQATRAALMGVLLSPKFLYLQEQPGPLDDFAVAARLSYFLWSSMPDEELLNVAEQQTLRQPEVLHAQVERMLNDPKAKAFTENFVGQWLALRDIDFTEPSHLLYPEFDDMLKVSMVRETELFFAELLKDDLSLTNFVQSDFTMLNGRLAKHYGIPGVDGFEFKKTPLPPESHRGGVLTMASVLKVTANGTTTSPVMRGAWILDRILGSPAPPPPADVPALEPDTRGATTIREQLAKHRTLPDCASCHVTIDPPGFALESFDVIGGWRDNYRTTGNGKSVTVDGRRMPYHEGKPVDPSDVFEDQPFQNVDDFKQLLLKDKDRLARSLATKLLTYATGGRSRPADEAEIDALVAKIREKNYGLRSLVHAITQSAAFQTK
jgi:mono/diheme cytochrome c family protein